MNISDSAHTSGSSSRPAAATLEFREATKLYPGQDEPAVDGLSLEVPSGEICVLVGPSGCGKTTAMRMVNRMIESQRADSCPTAQVKERKPAELRREIGYAIQQIGLFPHLSVSDNIATVPRLLGWDKQRIRSRVDELLELVSLDPNETRDRFPAQLSGGQRQRIGVARALAVDPPLMLMDEPFGASTRSTASAAERVPAPAARDPQDDRVRDPQIARRSRWAIASRFSRRGASSPSTRRPRVLCTPGRFVEDSWAPTAR